MNQIFTVQGMTCGHCEKAVTVAIKTVDANAQVNIDRTKNSVEVVSEAPREALIAAIQVEGYDVTA